MVAWKASKASVAALMDGPINMSAQCRQAPSPTCLPSMRMSLQSADSAPWAVIRFSALDFPAPGSPPSSMFRSARLTWTCSPYSSRPRWIGSKMENGNTRTVLMGGSSLPGMACGQGREKNPGVLGWGWPQQGHARHPAPGLLSLFPAVVFTGKVINGRLTVITGSRLPALPGPVGAQRRNDGVSGREGVVADNVDGHQLGPFAIAGDPRFAGIAGGAQFAPVGVEVLGADTGAAQQVQAYPDLGRPGPQDEGQPPRAGVQPGFPAQPLDAVPGQHAPEPAARPRQHACGGAVEPDEQVIQGVGVVPLVAVVTVGVVRHGVTALSRWCGGRR